MPFVTDPEWLDRVTWKKGPGSVHDRVIRIAYEATPPQELPDEPLSVYSRLGYDCADGSLESLDFVLRLEREFRPPDWPRVRRGWFARRFGGVWPRFEAEFFESYRDDFRDGVNVPITLGHIILFFESLEQG